MYPVNDRLLPALDWAKKIKGRNRGNKPKGTTYICVYCGCPSFFPVHPSCESQAFGI